MASGISISIAADTKAFTSNVDQMATSLSKASKELDGLGRGGDAGQIESDLRKTADAASTAGEKVKAEGTAFRDLAEQAQTSNRQVAQSEDDTTASVELSTREQTRLKREALTQVGESAKQAAVQSASDIDGTLGGLANASTSALTGVLSTLPPEYAALGAAGVAAFSLISGAMQRTAAEEQAVKEAAAAMVTTFIAGTGSGKAMIEQLQKMSETVDGSSTDLGALEKAFDSSGDHGVRSFADLARALASQKGGYDGLLRSEKEHLDQLRSVGDESARLSGQNAASAGSANQEADAQQKLVDALEAHKDAADQATLAEQAYRDATVTSTSIEDQRATAAEAGAKRQRAAAQTVVDGLKDIDSGLEAAAQNTADFYDGKKKTYDVAGYVKSLATAAQAIRDNESYLLTAPLSDAAKGFIQAQAPEVQAGIIAVLKQAGPAQQVAMNAQYTTLGQNAGDVFHKALAEAVSNPIPGPTIGVLVKTPDFKSIVQQAQNYLDSHPVQLRTGTTAGRFAITVS